jgi:bacillolysin
MFGAERVAGRHRVQRGAALCALALPALAVLAVLGAVPVQASVSSSAPFGTFALSGAAARQFRLPVDVQLLRASQLPSGITQTRYQQIVSGVPVYGGRFTVLSNGDREQLAVIGAYFPGLRASNTVAWSAERVQRAAQDRIGSQGSWSTKLWLSHTGTLEYEVDTIRAGSHPSRMVDAGTGAVLASRDRTAFADGTGVKGDHKTFTTTPGGVGFLLQSPDGRRATYDAGNKFVVPGTLMTDADDHWDLTLGRSFHSPDQRPGVDAFYYSGVADAFYRDTFGRNSFDDAGMRIVTTVHYGRHDCNAFWDGAEIGFPDMASQPRVCIPNSGALDLVAHEFTHGVTQYTSGLTDSDDPTVPDETGGLNESFSDMMAATAEFYADRHGLDPTVTPDWYFGEDVFFGGGVVPGGRNMSDPAEDGDPDHYSELTPGMNIHRIGEVSNHAYYLAVNGGRNAGCDNVGSDGHTHTLDCDVAVAPLGLDTGAQIFYAGFTSLVPWANMCDARNATVASANGLYGAGAAVSTSDAWAAVGLHSGCTASVQPPPACTGSDNATIPFATPHPYGNSGDCTWTYDNGSGGFAFHFSLLDTEPDYDYVRVADAAGNVVATYTGSYRKGMTSPCIPTASGSVHFTSDSATSAQGFIVDSVLPC